MAGRLDRISNLHDDVLAHILSFLPTKYSVRTTVLSTRFNKLFTLVPVLDFEYEKDGYDHVPMKPTRFVNFVNYAFKVNSLASIKKISFSIYGRGVYYYISNWISEAIHRNVEILDIAAHYLFEHKLPQSFFSCKTLTRLTLKGFAFTIPPDDSSSETCLPCLRYCHLQYVGFDDQSARRFFRNCPTLQVLNLSNWNLSNVDEVLDISSPTLEILSLEHAESIAVDVPNLVHFYYTGTKNGRVLRPDKIWKINPFLMTCHLWDVDFDDQEVLRLLKSFMVLKELKLRERRVMGGKIFEGVLNISSSTLNRLFLKPAHRCRIVLDVPNLLNFHYSGAGKNHELIGLETMKKVVDAKIFYDRNHAGSGDNNIVKFVWSINHVQQLFINDQVIKAFSRSGNSLPTFNNVTYLEFGLSDQSLPWELLRRLLDSTPRLVSLSLQTVYAYKSDAHFDMSPENVPECVSLHLKEVIFANFTGLAFERELANYFLEHSKHLKKIIFRSNRSCTYEISSAKCQIVLNQMMASFMTS